MKIELRHIGRYGLSPSPIIEITVTSNNTTVTEDIVNFEGYVDENFIDDLKDIVEQLEVQNTLINKQSI